MALRLSQLDPLPNIGGLKIGETLGRGAFAIVKSGYARSHKPNVFAVKFVHRQMCHRHGQSDDDIGREVFIHKACKHPNIVECFFADSTRTWLYIGLELASGGDLFDKIEPDVGLDEDLAHFYFKQLINAVSFLHSKGVAHRDIKPENILLDERGNLKLADFGLACVFKKSADKKNRLSTKACGSPPYVAPEIGEQKAYDAEYTDVWSCGIALFVIACGQLPWEIPCDDDPDFLEFRLKEGKVQSDGWNRIPFQLLALLRFILKISVEERPSIERIRRHVWVNRTNNLSTDDGLCKDTVALTSKLLSKLHIGLSDDQYELDYNSQQKYDAPDHFIASQPITDIAAMINDEDDPLRDIPATQQVFTEHNRYLLDEKIDSERNAIIEIISKDPAALQFSSRREGIEGLTISGRLTKFYSILPIESLLPILTSALNRIGIPTSDFDDVQVTEASLRKSPLHLSIHTNDQKKLPLRGEIKISRYNNLRLKTVDFVRTRGDPLQWRRFFKRITVLSRESVYVGDEQ